MRKKSPHVFKSKEKSVMDYIGSSLSFHHFNQFTINLVLCILPYFSLLPHLLF